MSRFDLEVRDADLKAALTALSDRVNNISPFLQGLGDDITERTKRRFETSTGPDGVRWKANSQATMDALASRLAGKRSYTKKDGSLNAKGSARLANKKPLIDTGELRRQIVPQVSGNVLTVHATPVYAAIHQFGGLAGRGHKVKIEARPFLPVTPTGDLYPAEKAEVLAAINGYLLGR